MVAVHPQRPIPSGQGHPIPPMLLLQCMNPSSSSLVPGHLHVFHLRPHTARPWGLCFFVPPACPLTPAPGGQRVSKCPLMTGVESPREQYFNQAV